MAMKQKEKYFESQKLYIHSDVEWLLVDAIELFCSFLFCSVRDCISPFRPLTTFDKWHAHGRKRGGGVCVCWIS